MRRLLTGLVVLLGLAGAAHAVLPSEMLPDPALERRAEALGTGLRCLVCQNESIEESNADLAHDLRVLLRQRLAAGDSDEAAVQYIVARYGDYVLLRPPLKSVTLALWLGPPLVLVLGGGLALLFLKKRQGGGPAALDAEERARLDVLLGRKS